MKRWVMALVILFLLLLCFLGQTAMDPEDFSGEWYSSQEQAVYLFEEGIIYCQKYPIAVSEYDYISGGYAFSGKSVFLFAKGIDGLETAKEVYLIQNADESILCEHKDGTGNIYFVRDNRKK